MSPAMLRAVMGSCLALGAADLAWLDLNAERIASAGARTPSDRSEPLSTSIRIERLPPLPTPSPPSDEVPSSAAEAKSANSPNEPAWVRPSTPTATAPQSEECVVYFERGSSFFGGDQAKALVPIADAVKNDPSAVVRVDGHADRTAWSGAGSNMVLSDQRAGAIVQALVRLGVARDRVRPAAFSDTRPVDEGSTEEAFRRNRRVEVRIERLRAGDR
jgi:outer membrane protein OmpA-like peptidoglycan-associated protein